MGGHRLVLTWLSVRVDAKEVDLSIAVLGGTVRSVHGIAECHSIAEYFPPAHASHGMFEARQPASQWVMRRTGYKGACSEDPNVGARIDLIC
jgi:hypothetical protein